tara:strand:- start:12949 stop:13230 length:282 start_codon:yes stop_codon:yes gene_type:complete
MLMNNISILIFAVSSSVATIVYSLKNIKTLRCCYGCSSCEQKVTEPSNIIPSSEDMENETTKTNVEKQAQVTQLKSQIGDLSEVLASITTKAN